MVLGVIISGLLIARAAIVQIAAHVALFSATNHENGSEGFSVSCFGKLPDLTIDSSLDVNPAGAPTLGDPVGFLAVGVRPLVIFLNANGIAVASAYAERRTTYT